MKKKQIIAKAICVFRKEDAILVCEGFDEVKGTFYYRPIGGKIEFGETSSKAIRREILEEIEASITNLKHVGTIENIFTYNGDDGHEIVFVHEADFIEMSFYEKDSFWGQEDNGIRFKLLWKPISDFLNNKCNLVPDGLFELL
ncbi:MULTISPECIES: NUDIX hydrolase [Lysinibacillus]|uniref:NUDIX hydrolase n=1 Tax=Lysinibacillus TaxID=400634 RepID=UPI001C2F9A67|nr:MULTISPECIES: NUDIX domain-containing protein [Lysinibacillus]MCK1988479.1 NUDIX domain-containing protein [Lysinibacillus fusiformis]MDC6267961.1 NUDIX domain-containing protein [Lysinibacillus sphaericus]MDN4967549.1 NUDIX domain-containing protein [Lysinibacillus fusiformis]